MEEVRDIVRETVLSNQHQKRESLLNRNRNIENVEGVEQASKETVVKLANDLKKKNITPKKLSDLKEIFLQQKENVDHFLEVDGALEALVKALSGQNAKLQINAAYCLCNLSLGDKYLKITKVAGPYLVLHLEGMNTYLIEACAWTIGNLSSHHKKCTDLLKSQGALELLVRLLNHTDDNVRIAGCYALSRFIYTGYDELTSDEFQVLTDAIISLFKEKHTSAAYLLSLLSGSSNCQFKLLQAGVLNDCLHVLLTSLNKTILECSWYIRVIGNLITETTGEAALLVLNFELPTNDIRTFLDSVDYIVRSGQIFLIKECCWVLGNLINHQNQLVVQRVLESGILDKISNPVRYLLLPKTEGPH